MKYTENKFPRIVCLVTLILLGFSVKNFLEQLPGLEEDIRQRVRFSDIKLPAGKNFLEKKYPLSLRWMNTSRGNYFFGADVSGNKTKKSPFNSVAIIVPYIKLNTPKTLNLVKPIPKSTLPKKPKTDDPARPKPESPVSYHGVVSARFDKTPRVLFKNKKDETFFTMSPGETVNDITLLEIMNKSVKIRTAEGKEFEVTGE